MASVSLNYLNNCRTYLKNLFLYKMFLVILYVNERETEKFLRCFVSFFCTIYIMKNQPALLDLLHLCRQADGLTDRQTDRQPF